MIVRFGWCKGQGEGSLGNRGNIGSGEFTMVLRCLSFGLLLFRPPCRKSFKKLVYSISVSGFKKRTDCQGHRSRSDEADTVIKTDHIMVASKFLQHFPFLPHHA